jgi:hypothetical protein
VEKGGEGWRRVEKGERRRRREEKKERHGFDWL